jgi:hypothetical protein
LEALFIFVSVGSIDTTPSSFVHVLSIKLHFTKSWSFQGWLRSNNKT